MQEIFPKILKSTDASSRNNTYYIDDEKKVQIDASEILDKPVDILVLTHFHIDHVYYAGEIKKKTGCKIAASEETAYYLKKNGPEILAHMTAKKLEPIVVDVILQNGGKLFTGEYKWNVLKTPGHTSGCISLWEPNKKILFSGDCWFGGESVGRTDFPTSSQKELNNSLKILKELKPEILLPGHDY